MNQLLFVVGKSLNVLAEWVSHISLRGFVVIMGILLAFALPNSQILKRVDHAFLSLNSYLFSSPRSTADIAIVRVPTEEMSTWQSDIHSSGKLAALLSNILNSSDSKVGLLMSQPIDTGSGAADSLIETFIEQDTDSDNYKHAKALVDRKFILMDLLSNDRVVIGVRQFVFSGQKPLLSEPSSLAFIPPFIQKFFLRNCADCFNFHDGVVVARPTLEEYTAIYSEAPFAQAVFSSAQGERYNGFLVQLLRTMEGVDTDENLVWRQGRGVAIGNIDLPLSSSGQFIPLHGLTERMAPIVNTIPLNEALARNAFPKVILIASDSDQSVEALAAALFSVTNDAAFFSPWWAPIFMMGLIIFVTVYFALVVTRFNHRVLVAVSLILGLSIFSAQIAFLVSKNIWLPVAMPLSWLVVGHFLIVVWRVKNSRVQHLVDRADDICINRAQQLIEDKELQGAYSQLKDCSIREPLLQTLYDISEAYTEQKDYQQAINVLTSIQNKHKSFRDTEQKLQVLTSMLKTMEEDVEVEPLQQTMVINPDAQEKRVLGRYELEREIGRGAMGRVYLGFDPRISRRVAVKTLSYDNFSGKEKDDIKARFYREAEAAGRLNHPSIVSVYDVGEEGDMAFIAMDFAEGKALSSFVKPDNLLPVFEVYRIVCDVAMALEYAHENNIVHRDVKPGNIIYNPSPYQVRVTDFGIARLTDDSKTSTGEILGSPLYMAPEQLKGKKVNRAADIFSLGVTFYQLLTGHLPYDGDNLAALTYEIIHGRHRSVRTVRKDLPASAARITNQALQKDPNDRYETAAEMASVLKKAIKRDFASEAKKIGYV